MSLEQISRLPHFEVRRETGPIALYSALRFVTGE